jgi:hypothetical protein
MYALMYAFHNEPVATDCVKKLKLRMLQLTAEQRVFTSWPIRLLDLTPCSCEQALSCLLFFYES